MLAALRQRPAIKTGDGGDGSHSGDDGGARELDI
jgi:hypothetical protein